MAVFDLPLALEQLTKEGRLQPGEDWGSQAQTGATYEQFFSGWRGASTIPTQVELAGAWDRYKAARRRIRQVVAIRDDAIDWISAGATAAERQQRSAIVAATALAMVVVATGRPIPGALVVHDEPDDS